MEYLIAAIAALVGLLFYTNTKRKSAEALLENQEVKGKLNEQDKEIAKNQGLLEVEKAKREELSKEVKPSNATVDDLNSILKPNDRP